MMAVSSEPFTITQKYYEQIFQLAPEGCWILGPDLKTLEVNLALSEILGYERKELLGQYAYRFCQDKDGAVLVEKLRDLKPEGRCTFEIQIHNCQSAERTLRLSATAIPDEDGKILFYFAFVTDVTVEKESLQALTMAHLELDRIFNTATDAMCVISRDKTVLRQNEAFTHLLGTTDQSGIGRRCYEVFAKESCRHSSKCSLHRILQGEEKVEQDFKLRLKDGSLRYCTLTATALKDPNGQILGIVENIRDITERKKFEDTMRFQAYHDILTGLPNRRLLYEILEKTLVEAKKEQSMIGVAFLDFDGMKQVNDQFGHDSGDELIRIVAKRLRNSIREDDHIARVGGDEFILIFRHILSRQDAFVVANRILEHLKEPIVLQGMLISITASIGMSFYPEDGDDLRKLLRGADLAMYEAKDRGRGLICCSSPTCCH